MRRPTPPPPSLLDDAGPAAVTPPGPGAPAQPQNQPEPQPAPSSSSAAATPGPASAPSQAPAGVTTGQVLGASAQGGYYASPPPAAPPRPRCKLLDWICPFKKHGPLPSSQFPPATFPTSYSSCVPGAGQALPTPQGCSSACTTTPEGRYKKPCCLKTWIHKVTCPGQECGCGGRGSEAHKPTVMASPQCSLSSLRK
jgi:hypothetical protein